MCVTCCVLNVHVGPQETTGATPERHSSSFSSRTRAKFHTLPTLSRTPQKKRRRTRRTQYPHVVYSSKNRTKVLKSFFLKKCFKKNMWNSKYARALLASELGARELPKYLKKNIHLYIGKNSFLYVTYSFHTHIYIYSAIFF